MKNGYKYTLGVLTIMILLTITVGTSYSYYTVSETQQGGSNSLATTCFEIDYQGSNDIKMNTPGNYAYPMTESVATGTGAKPYTFTVKNTCTSANAGTNKINYDVYLSTVTGTTLSANAIRYRLDFTGGNASSAILSSKTGNNKLDNETITKYGIQNTYVLTSGSLSLDPNTSKDFKLYLWIDENQGNDVMDLVFNGKILVYAYMD